MIGRGNRFWMGTNAGFEPGEVVRPAKDGGVLFVTTDREWARAMAHIAGRGSLYSVEVIGVPVVSAKYEFPTYEAEAVEIRGVLDCYVQMTRQQMRRLARRREEIVRARVLDAKRVDG